MQYDVLLGLAAPMPEMTLCGEPQSKKEYKRN